MHRCELVHPRLQASSSRDGPHLSREPLELDAAGVDNDLLRCPGEGVLAPIRRIRVHLCTGALRGRSGRSPVAGEGIDVGIGEFFGTHLLHYYI